MNVFEKSGWALVIFLALLTSVFAIHRLVLVHTRTESGTIDSLEVRLPGAAVQVDRRYNEIPGWTSLHLIPGLTFMLLGPLQFSRRIRARYIGFHRWSGRIFLAVTLGGTIAGMIMAAGPTYIGANAIAAAYFFGALCIASTLKAYYHIRRKEILLHREWMIRAFALGLGVSTVRLVTIPLILFTSLNLPDVMGVSFWVGWTLSMIAGEIWINVTRS